MFEVRAIRRRPRRVHYADAARGGDRIPLLFLGRHDAGQSLATVCIRLRQRTQLLRHPMNSSLRFGDGDAEAHRVEREKNTSPMKRMVVVHRSRTGVPRSRRNVHDFGLNPAVPCPWRDHVSVPHRNDQHRGNAHNGKRNDRPNQIPEAGTSGKLIPVVRWQGRKGQQRARRSPVRTAPGAR